MKTRLLALTFFISISTFAQITLQEKLGYKKTDKLLIIHADDLGVSHSENAASIEALEHGSVGSASIMVPCPWFPEIAAYATAHPKADFGLHMTLTSEWKTYRWPTVAAKATVPTLTNSYNFMYASVDSVISFSNAAEVETELRTQIERAKQFGIDITHLDSHMGTLYAKPDFLNVLRKLGKEYRIPVMLTPQILTANHISASNGDVVIDTIYIENPSDYKSGTTALYTRILNDVKPGVSLIIIHTAHDDSEMQAVTIDHPDYGSAWRQADFNFFTGAVCKQLLEKNNIHVITWREIRDKIVRK